MNASVPVQQLAGEAEAQYVDRLVRILRAARLNLYYPDSRRMCDHIAGLAPAVHRGLYDGVEIDARSGLPSYREWTRVQTDVSIASDQLRQLGDRAQLERKAREAGPESIHARQLLKVDYYRDMERRRLQPLGDMEVALRRVDPDSRTAWFHVVLDKLDASGVFVRYTIDLAQQDRAWSTRLVQLDAETARHTEEFQSLIYKFTSLDAEFTFLKLASMPDLTIERVARGTVGPVYWTPEQAPELLAPLVPAETGGPLAMFALDMIATDIAEDRNNDPLDELFSGTLGQRAREAVTTSRRHFAQSHKHFKDRKFVTTRQHVPQIRAFCEARGCKNIIYGI